MRERERERETYMKPKRMGVLDSMRTSVVSLLKQKCLHTVKSMIGMIPRCINMVATLKVYIHALAWLYIHTGKNTPL